MASAAAEHFEATHQQVFSLRRQFAAMVAIEQNLLCLIRRLLPVSMYATSAIAAIQRTDQFCAKFEERKTQLPFE